MASIRETAETWKETALDELQRQHANVVPAKEQQEKNAADRTRPLDEAQVPESWRLQIKLQEGLAAQREPHLAEIKAIVKSHEDKLAEVAEEHRRVLAAKKEKYKVKMTSIMKDIKNLHKENLTKQAEELKSALEAQQLIHQGELNVAKKTHQASVEQLIANHSKYVQRLEGQLDEKIKQERQLKKIIEKVFGTAQPSNANEPGTSYDEELKSFPMEISQMSPQVASVATSTDVPCDAEARQLQDEKDKLQNEHDRPEAGNQQIGKKIITFNNVEDQFTSEKQTLRENATAECEQLGRKVEVLKGQLQAERESSEKARINNEQELKLLYQDSDARMEKLRLTQEKLEQDEHLRVSVEQELRQEVTDAENNAALIDNHLKESQAKVQQLQAEIQKLAERLETQANEFDAKLADQKRNYENLYKRLCEHSESLKKAEQWSLTLEQEMQQRQYDLTACKDALDQLRRKSLMDLQESQRRAAEHLQAERWEKNALLEKAQELRQFMEAERKKCGQLQADNQQLRQERECVRREFEGKLRVREGELQTQLEDLQKRLHEAQMRLSDALEKVRTLEETYRLSAEGHDGHRKGVDKETAEMDNLRSRSNEKMAMVTDLHNQMQLRQQQAQSSASAEEAIAAASSVILPAESSQKC